MHSYLLVWQVVCPLPGLHMESGILSRDVVPHQVFENAVLDERHSWWGVVWRQVITSKLLIQTTPMPIGFIGSREIGYTTHPRQQPTSPPFMITTHHTTITPLWYMPSSSLWLTWLTNLALVTSVYPNQMQYAPLVLQEASLLDGVDASVCGNGRRFSKTSSYPPCC